MTRPGRLLFDVATAASLLPFVPLAWLWASSWIASVELWRDDSVRPPLVLSAEHGRLHYGRVLYYSSSWEALWVPDERFTADLTPWLALAAAVPLARLLVRVGPPVRAALARRFAPRPGHCRECGYDLRATPDRCPECGAAAVAPVARGDEGPPGWADAVPREGK